MPRKRLLLIIAYYAFVVIGLKPGLLNIAWEHIEESFGLSLDSLAVLLGFGTAGYLFSAFVSGRLISRFGMGFFLLTGSIMSIIGALGFVLAPSWGLLLLASFISSVGSGMIDAGLNTFASANYDAGSMNWLHAFFGVGTTIGPLAMGFIVLELEMSWRVPYLLVVVLQFILAGLIIANRKYWRVGEEELAGAPGSSASVSMLETLKSPVVILSLLLFFMYGGVEIGTGQLVNTLFTEGRGISEVAASQWVSIYWGSFTVGRMLIGTFVNRIGSFRLMRISVFATVIGAVLLAVNISNPVSFLGVAVLGFAQAPVFPTLISETPRRVGLRHAANTIGFQVGITGLGGTLLPGIAGSLSDTFGLEIISVLIVFCAVAVFALHESLLASDMRRLQVSTATD